MTLLELTDTILSINPNAKFSVWDLSTGQYYGDRIPIIVLGYAVDWNITNTLPCPTEAEILAAYNANLPPK